VKHVDDELRHALRRVEPPAGFVERVLQRTADTDLRMRRQLSSGRGDVVRRWVTAAALVVALTSATWYGAERWRLAQGESAKREVLLGLRVTSSKLQLAQLRVNQHVQGRTPNQ